MPDTTRDLPEIVVKAVDPTVEQLKVVSDSTVGCGEGAQVIVEAQNRWGFTATDPAQAGPVALILVGTPSPAEGLPSASLHPERKRSSGGAGEATRTELGEVELTEGVGRGEVELPAAGIFRIEAVAEGGLKAVSDPIEVSETAGGPLLLWGDIHAHIRERRAQALISGADRLMGPATVEEAYTFARDVAGLHFASITDHALHLTDLEWEQTIQAADEFTQAGRFIAFPGYEWGCSSGFAMNFGHRNVIYRGGDDLPLFRCCEERTHSSHGLHAALRDAVPVEDLLVIPHHTARGGGQTWQNWDYYDPDLERLCEVYSIWGSSEKMGEPYPIKYLPSGGYFGTGEAAGHHLQDGLALGYRFGFVAGSESHDGRPSRSLIHGRELVEESEALWPPGVAAVWADEFSRDGVFEALRARRCYGTTGARMIVRFFLGDEPMGSDVAWPDPNEPRELRAEVIGTAPIASCVIVKNNRDVHEVASDTEHLELEYADPAEAGPGDFYYLRVTQADGQMAWASPIFLV